MTDTNPIKTAQTLIADLNKAYQACKQATADDVRFQEQLNSILGFLAKAETVDNRVLIELEKFYQTSSLLMGARLNSTSFLVSYKQILILHLTFHLIRKIQDL